jgi:GntR family transcriptional regulator, transcriptional repressor for pyruvate dehydrogenase complex
MLPGPGQVTRLKPVKRRSGVKLQVYEQLRDGIIRGSWPAGTRLPSEGELVEELGCSRISIREALQMLASLGLVESHQGGGTFVRAYSAEVLLSPLLPMIALDRTGILHVQEYRRIVESGCVALAVIRANDENIAALECCCATMRSSTDDIGAFARADLEFHMEISRASRNPVLVKANSVIRDILGASMEEVVRALGTHDGLYYHHRILKAVRARDAVSAVALMEEHIVRTIERLRKKWGE